MGNDKIESLNKDIQNSGDVKNYHYDFEDNQKVVLECSTPKNKSRPEIVVLDQFRPKKKDSVSKK